MKTVNVTLTGITPLLMHMDGIMEADKIKEWRKHKDNKHLSVPGDDRSPAWTWLSYLYHQGAMVGIPSDNLMTMFREAGAKVPMKGRLTFKTATQTSLVVSEPMWEIFNREGVSLDFTVLHDKLWGENDFQTHMDIAHDAGISLFVKRARIGQAKHIRVRAQWAPGWSVQGQVLLRDDKISIKGIRSILETAGSDVGLCDWRPSSNTPGSFGMFEAKVTS
jgi:hypothetical protein